MNEEEFEKLLQERENRNLELKLGLPEPKKVARLVSAFYNSCCGKIVFGVEHATRKPVGLKNPQETEHEFRQSIRQWCSLDKEPETEFVKYKGNDFIVVHCPKGRDTPYFVRGEHVPRVRIGSSNMPANKKEIARLYMERSLSSPDVCRLQK